MSKKYLIFCLLLSFTCCQSCLEKSILNDGEDKSICGGLSTSSIEKACVYDINTNGCVEKECNDLNAEECYKISGFEDDSTSTPNIRKKKTDNSGCELKHCEDLTNHCERFSLGDVNEKCSLNVDNSHCEIQKCSDLTENCENFIPEGSSYKCAPNAIGCEIKEKECEDYTPDNCEKYFDDVTFDKCILDTSTNKCKLFRCQDLPSSECDKFEINADYTICAPKGEKCQIQTCSDFSEKVCETIKFPNDAFRCVFTESGCVTSFCQDFSNLECDKFIPLDPLLKCAPAYEYCTIQSKQCEELDKDHCDLYNTEEDKEGGGWLCVEKDGKCVIGAKYVEISLLFLLLLLFLF